MIATGMRQLSFVGSVSAVRFSPDERLLYAGVGPELRVYRVSDGQLLEARHVVAAGSRVHGIEFQSCQFGWEVGVYGQKSVSVLRCARGAVGREDGVTHVESANFPQMQDWIMGFCFAPVDGAAANCQLVLIGSAHNRVDVWQYAQDQDAQRPAQATHVSAVLCDTRCLLYSLAFFSGRAKHGVLAASGTTFGVVVLWRVQPEGHAASAKTSGVKEIARLGRHNGVIVRLSFSRSGNYLCSASDDRTIKVWKRAAERDEYSLHRSFDGPTRVWDCAILDAIDSSQGACSLYSSGEDGICRMYDLRSGDLQSTMKGHLGCVWRTALANTTRLVATAGEDSTIKIWPIVEGGETQHDADTCRWLCFIGNECPGEETSSSAKRLEEEDADCVKCFAVGGARKDTIFAATSRGRVYSCDVSLPGNPLVCVWHSDKFSFVSAIAVGHSRLLLGSVDGRALLLNTVDFPSSPVVWQAHQHRILKLWWQPELGNSAVISAPPNGEIKLWRLCSESIPAVHATFQCRPGNAIGAITLVRCGKAVVVICGDNKGFVYGFHYPLAMLAADGRHQSTGAAITFASGESKLRLEAVSTVVESSARVKRGGRIVSIAVHREIAYVLARDGYIVRYSVTAAQQAAYNTVTIQLVGKIKVANSISAIDNVVFTQAARDQLQALDDKGVKPNGDVLVSGFRSVDFVLWNITKHYQICKVPCGGSRRPYIVAHRPGAPTDYTLAFAAGHGTTVEFHTQQQSSTSISPLLSLNANFHSRDVNAVLFVKVCRHHGQLGSSPVVVVTGSEDTLVQVRAHNFAGRDETLGWDVGHHTLHGHPSAIKALCCSHIDGRWPVVFSVGAKQSIMAWQFAVGPETGTVDRFSSQLLCRWSRKLHNKLSLASRQPVPSIHDRPREGGMGTQESVLDHRFHAVVAFPLGELDSSSGSHVVVVGGTSPTVDVWTLEEESRSIVAAASLAGHCGLVLCLAQAHTRRDGRPFAVVAAGDTSGSVCIWDVTAATTDALFSSNLPPVHVLRGAHQSGVNCACMFASETDSGDGCVSLLTGGDDQSIYVSCLRFGQDPVELWNYRRVHAHSSSLKGLALGRDSKGLIFSTSADCRLHVWKLSLPSEADQSLARLDRLDSAVLSVANVAACEAVWGSTTVASGESTGHDVAVVGRGLQVYHHFEEAGGCSPRK